MIFYWFYFPTSFHLIEKEQTSWQTPCNISVEITWAPVFSWLPILPPPVTTIAYSKFGILWKNRNNKPLPENIQQRLCGFIRNKFKNGAIQ